MAKRQKVLVLYLKLPSLEGEVISWATFDGTGKKLHMTGDSDEPPYPTGLDALLDGWRLFQANNNWQDTCSMQLISQRKALCYWTAICPTQLKSTSMHFVMVQMSTLLE